MDRTAVKLPVAKPVLQNSESRRFVWLALILFVVVYAITVPGNAGDTSVYVNNILDYAQGSPAKPALLWEFGHLLWRPLGYVGWQLARPLTGLWFAGNPLLQIQFILFAFNFIGWIALPWLTIAITRRLGMSNLVALAICSGVLVSNAVVSYVHAGTSYVPGLALCFAGFWFTLRALSETRRRTIHALLAAIALACACDIWFLFVLGLPAALLVPLLLPQSAWRPAGESVSVRERWRIFSIILGVCAAIGIVSYAASIAICHIASIAELRAWIMSSGHGMHSDRPFFRFPTGITRSLIFLGGGGMAIKQFVFHDPNAPSRWTALWSAGLWKIALTFLALGSVLIYLARARDGMRVLAIVLAALIPTFAFAFLFDTSSPERYLPLYAAFVVAIPVIFQQGRAMRVPQWLLGIFLLALLLVNLKSYAIDLRALGNEAYGRAQIVHQNAAHGGVALIMSFSDPLSTYFHRRPFDPANQQGALPLYHVFDFASLGATPWDSAASCRILRTWNDGGEAWLSKRFLAAQPEADWGWVESDHPAVTWRDVTGFFQKLNTDRALGDRDGFVRIARNGANQQLLEGSCDGNEVR